MSKPKSSLRTFVYVSSAEDAQIHVFELTAHGQLSPGKTMPSAPLVGPMAINRDQKLLYVASRSKPSGVFVSNINPQTGDLSAHSNSALSESFPFICLDQSGHYLFGASYGASLVSVNKVEVDGSVDPTPVQIIHPGLNVHSIRIDASNRFVLVPALGSDCVLQLTFDDKTGQLSPNEPRACVVATGAGPRHFVFSGDQRFVYLLNELTGEICTFQMNPNHGQLTPLAVDSILPPGSPLRPGLARHAPAFEKASPSEIGNFIWAADLHITKNGRFLYASERTHSTITVFEVNTATGQLQQVACIETLKQPRGFAIDPSDQFLIATGELSDKIACYAINSDSGKLTLTCQRPSGKFCSWVEIVQLKPTDTGARI